MPRGLVARDAGAVQPLATASRTTGRRADGNTVTTVANTGEHARQITGHAIAIDGGWVI